MGGESDSLEAPLPPPIDPAASPEPRAEGFELGGEGERWSQTHLRHRQIINMAFAGASAERIAAAVSMHPNSVRMVIKSPAAQAAFAAMQEKAEASITNVPLRLAMERELNDDAAVARRVQRTIMENELVEPRARLMATRHFLDRVVFSTPPPEPDKPNYAAILRKIDELDRSRQTVNIVTPQVTITPSGESDSLKAPLDTTRTPPAPGGDVAPSPAPLILHDAS